MQNPRGTPGPARVATVCPDARSDDDADGNGNAMMLMANGDDDDAANIRSMLQTLA